MGFRYTYVFSDTIYEHVIEFPSIDEIKIAKKYCEKIVTNCLELVEIYDCPYVLWGIDFVLLENVGNQTFAFNFKKGLVIFSWVVGLETGFEA